jgi:hypothetical protein
MKKSILTLAFAVALMCVGAGVSEANTPLPSTNNLKIEQNKGFNANKLKSISPSNAEFKKKYAELKELCKNNFGPLCDQAITNADGAAQAAWAICQYNMSLCQAAQNIALAALENAMITCRAEEPLVALHSQKPKLGEPQSLLIERRRMEFKG